MYVLNLKPFVLFITLYFSSMFSVVTAEVNGKLDDSNILMKNENIFSGWILKYQCWFKSMFTHENDWITIGERTIDQFFCFDS